MSVCKRTTIIIGASIGISLYPTDGDQVTVLLQNADIALCQAKGEGKNTFRFYSSRARQAAPGSPSVAGGVG